MSATHVQRHAIIQPRISQKRYKIGLHDGDADWVSVTYIATEHLYSDFRSYHSAANLNMCE